jgi:YVTN family beta-propeller protein
MNSENSIGRIPFLRAGLAALVCLAAIPACYAQTVTATLATGPQNPYALAVNPVTDKIYVTASATGGSSSVIVIDGATNNLTNVPVPGMGAAVAVNPLTNKIYVTDLAADGSGSVKVIDGATNNFTNVAVGHSPVALAVNPATNKIYVANENPFGANGGSVTVIDGASNVPTNVSVGTGYPWAVAVNPVTNKIYVVNNTNVNNFNGSMTVIDGATNKTTTVTGVSSPIAVAVNPVTNMIYVLNFGESASVAVIDGGTNTVVATVPVGTFSSAQSNYRPLAVNPVTNMIYVANNGSNNVSVIDGRTNIVIATPQVGSGAVSLAVDPATNQIYAAGSGGSVTVIDGAVNSVEATVPVGAFSVAVNPVTNKIYGISGNSVAVIDGATDRTAGVTGVPSPLAVGVNPVTGKIYVANGVNTVTLIEGPYGPTTPVTIGGVDPIAVAVNAVTNMVYVASESGKVTVIDGGSSDSVLAIIDSPGDPVSLAVNPVTNMIYAANAIGTVTAINGATNAATIIPMPAGSAPSSVAVNPVTNRIYVANNNIVGTVTVIDGATNTILTTLSAGSAPHSVAVNPVTNMIYVANVLSGSVTAINGVTNEVTSVMAGINPASVAVNPITNKIYVANPGSSYMTVIDGATNMPLNVPAGPGNNAVAVNQVTDKIYFGSNSYVTAFDGITNTVLTTVFSGAELQAPAVNPVTNTIYFADNAGDTVLEMTEQQLQSNPLTTSITALPGNQTSSPAPAFTFNVADSFSPTATTPDAVFYQTDTWQNQWSKATATGGTPAYAGTLASLQPGFHILYAFAGDSQEATSTEPVSPLIGAIQAYGFLVVPNPPKLTVSPTNLVYPGGANVSVCVTPVANAPTATGTIQILDGTNILATLPEQGNGCANWYISPGLNAGIHSLTAFYSGDGNNPPGTSAAVTVTVSPVPTYLEVACYNSLFGYGGNFTCDVGVNADTGGATGNITYTVDGGTPVSLALGNGGTQFSLIRPNPGSHTVTISYAQQGNFAAARSNTEDFLITPATPQISLTPSNYDPSAGSSLTLSAYVTSYTAGPPSSGVVTFFDNGAPIGTGSVNAQGQASFTIPAISAGSHDFVAHFGGTANFDPGTSGYVGVSAK